MREYKIKCNNPMIKSHAIEMLIELGYKDASTKDEYLTIVTFEDDDIYSTVPEDDQYEGNEILSMDQLKGLVVLKRNNVAKAETNMKEYLDKDYVLRVVKQTGGDNRVPSDWIEVPEGAVKLLKNNEDNKHFVSKDGHFMADYDIKAGFGYWYNSAVSLEYYFSCMGGTIVWSRHTQPEELPFVDDAHKRKIISVTVPLDPINHPSHYASGAVECIDAIESSMTKEAFAGYLKGNIQKYIWRYENKGGVESLQKAQWYLNRLILLQSA